MNTNLPFTIMQPPEENEPKRVRLELYQDEGFIHVMVNGKKAQSIPKHTIIPTHKWPKPDVPQAQGQPQASMPAQLKSQPAFSAFELSKDLEIQLALTNIKHNMGWAVAMTVVNVILSSAVLIAMIGLSYA